MSFKVRILLERLIGLRFLLMFSLPKAEALGVLAVVIVPLSAAGAGVPGAGGVVPVGGEFPVNTYTVGAQEAPAVAMALNGDFVVVWQSDGSSGTDADGLSVQGQLYASDGSPSGGEFQVNTYTTGSQDIPAVAMALNGDFVVVWQSDGSSGSDTDSSSILGQRFASDGSPLADELQLNAYTTSFQELASVAVVPDGSFVVVWHSNGSGGSDADYSGSIQARRFAANGLPLGDEFQVNTYTTSYQILPAVAVHATGDFVVVWESRGSAYADTSNLSVQGQRFAADGLAVGSQFEINTFTSGRQAHPEVVADGDGAFFVVWESRDLNGDRAIQGRRYSSDGTAAGGQLQLNSYTNSVQERPEVAIGADGDFVVVWHDRGSSGTDTSLHSVQARRFTSDGSTFGDEVQVNTYTTLAQFHPVVAMSTNDFVIVWDGYGSGPDVDLSIQGQRFRLDSTSLIFADGFESGDASAWSSTMP